jgi:hypothetical protein
MQHINMPLLQTTRVSAAAAAAAAACNGHGHVHLACLSVRFSCSPYCRERYC